MKKLLSGSLKLFGLFVVLLIVLGVSTSWTLLASLAVLGYAGVAVVKRVPAVGRGYAFPVGLVASLFVLSSLGAMADDRQLNALKSSDINAYLAALQSRSETRWLDALEELRPEEYEAEMSRRAATEEQIQLEREARLAELDREREARLEQARRERDARLEQERLEREERRVVELRQEAENRRKGFHCLSSWDGSHDAFKRAVREAMRDPRSFEHIETRITSVNEDGQHALIMEYRARNGFGGMTVGTATAVISNATCNVVAVASIE